jgi:hypothetical protein
MPFPTAGFGTMPVSSWDFPPAYYCWCFFQWRGSAVSLQGKGTDLGLLSVTQIAICRQLARDHYQRVGDPDRCRFSELRPSANQHWSFGQLWIDSAYAQCCRTRRGKRRAGRRRESWFGRRPLSRSGGLFGLDRSSGSRRPISFRRFNGVCYLFGNGRCLPGNHTWPCQSDNRARWHFGAIIEDFEDTLKRASSIRHQRFVAQLRMAGRWTIAQTI